MRSCMWLGAAMPRRSRSSKRSRVPFISHALKILDAATEKVATMIDFGNGAFCHASVMWIGARTKNALAFQAYPVEQKGDCPTPSKVFTLEVTKDASGQCPDPVQRVIGRSPGCSPDDARLVCRNLRKLPFAVRLGPKALRFSKQGLQKYIATRAGGGPALCPGGLGACAPRRSIRRRPRRRTSPSDGRGNGADVRQEPADASAAPGTGRPADLGAWKRHRGDDGPA